MTGEFDGATALVTGGASGIGAATVQLLRARGARVVVCDLNASGPDAVQCDVTDEGSVRSTVEAVVAQHGGIDLVVNSAGVGAVGSVAGAGDDQWRMVFEVNVFGVARVVRTALPHLRASSRAAVVNVCSIAANAGLPARAVYSASKGAVQSLTLAMAADHLAEGIRFNCVNPGTADTPWVQRLLAQADDPVAERAALEARQPHGRLVRADEVAAAIAYLLSPSAGSTTGTALAVDGGMQGLRVRR